MSARLSVATVAAGGAADLNEVQSRRLLLLERTMYRDGLTPFASVLTVRVRGDLNELRLREALTQMQAKHPLLRCRVEEAADGPRFVRCSKAAPLPLRIVERSNARDWEREARREWVMPFGSTQDPLARLVWLRGDGVHELMLVAHHCICDGPSGMTLLSDCFAAYSDPLWKTNAYDALGTIEDLVPEELLRDLSFRFRVCCRATLFRSALFAKVRRRPRNTRGPSADEMYFHRRQLDALELEKLTERCREESVTILAAAGAAFLQAFREVRGPGALRRAYAMVNARRFLPRLHPDALFGIAPGVAIRMKGPLSENAQSTPAFWERARAFRTGLTARVNRLGSRFYENLAALESLHDRYPRLVADTEAAPGVRHVTFSNLGKFDLPQQYRSFQVEHVYSPLVMVSPSPANTVVLSSFGRALETCIISDEQSLPRADAAAIHTRAMAILRSAAGIAPRDETSIGWQHSLERVATR
jgi:hypothetical protein